jgi:ribonuclease Z
MMKALRWVGPIVLLIGGIAWFKGEALMMGAFSRAVDKAIARDTIAGLDPKALHVGFCGTGSPLPSRDRGEACTLVVAGGRVFIFDAGEGAGGTITQMGISLGKAQGVWLTHLHSDHFEGLGGVMLQRWAGASATTPLAVFGPTGVDQVTAGLTQAFKIDSGYRIAHHGEAVVPPSGFGMTGTVIAPGIVYDQGGVRITAFPVSHAPVSPAFGYRLDWNGHSVTISGDTAASPDLIAAAKGSDILVHEMLSAPMVKIMQDAAAKAGLANRAKIMGDIPGYHATPEQAADAAKAAGVGYLALTHVVPSAPHFFDKVLVGDARHHFDGPITLMRDGDMLSVTGKGQISRQSLLP